MFVGPLMNVRMHNWDTAFFLEFIEGSRLPCVGVRESGLVGEAMQQYTGPRIKSQKERGSKPLAAWTPSQP